MKRLLVLLVAVGLFAVTPVLAAEHGGMKMQTDAGVRECALKAESIQEKIKRLEAEVASGEKKYDANTLKKLNNQLDEANKTLDQLNKR